MDISTADLSYTQCNTGETGGSIGFHHGVTFIRGVSGSGKSTMALELIKSARECGKEMVHVEADQYFTDSNGVYNFDMDRIGLAHGDAVARMLEALAAGHGVIVANTFKSAWEFDAYLKHLEAKCSVALITMHTLHQNVHGLSDEMIHSQLERFTPHDTIASVIEERLKTL